MIGRTNACSSGGGMSDHKPIRVWRDSITIPEALQDGENFMICYLHIFEEVQVDAAWPTLISVTSYAAVVSTNGGSRVTIGKGVTQADGSTIITPDSGYVFPDTAIAYYVKVKLPS